MGFFVTFSCVLTMLLYALPGYLMVRLKAIREDAVSAFAKLLMYVSAPCLTLYSFQRADTRPGALKSMAVFFLITLCLTGICLEIACLLCRRRMDDVRVRICCVACCFGNCTFMGVPLLESMLPEYAEGAMLANMFFLSMSIVGWTAGSAVIARDRRHMRLSKALLNPAVLAMALAIPLYLLDVRLPAQLGDMVALLGRMTTPLCMLILGMRLATVSAREIFCSPMLYATAAVKQLVIPLAVLALTAPLPMEPDFRRTLCILCCCPSASVVLNFAELLGEGQREAADAVLLSTLLSVATIPAVSLLL